MGQVFNNIIIGFHFFPGRSFLGIYFGCHIAEEGGREESMGVFWSMSSGHRRSPCLSFVQCRPGWLLQSCIHSLRQGKRRSALVLPMFLSTRIPIAHPPPSKLASVARIKIWDALELVEDEGGTSTEVQTWMGQQGLVLFEAFAVFFILTSRRCKGQGLPRGHSVLLPPPAYFADRLKHLVVYLLSAWVFDVIGGWPACAVVCH